MRKTALTLIFVLMATFISSCQVPTNSSESSIENSSNTQTSLNSSENSSSGNSNSSSDNSSSVAENHIDVDNNGYCDDCKESVTVTFDFFGVNDLHGKFDDTDDQPGVDELTTYLKSKKQANPNTILLSSGDMWQGSSESNLTNGRIIVDWMNELDFVSMTLGNHEYDWGEKYIKENAAAAEFPFLALNIFDEATDERVDYCEASVMVEMSGVKIGIIGAIGDCYSSISGEHVQDVYFKTGGELTELVKAESRKLRENGADYIIYSIHDGYGSSMNSTQTISGNFSYYNTVLSKNYVDMVFEGHTHQRYVFLDSKGVYHLQDGGDNDGISHANVTINFVNDTSVVNTAEFVSTSKYSTSYQDDPIVDQLLEKYKDKISIANEVLGMNLAYRNSTYLRRLIAQLYYQAGMEKWGDEYDIVLGGGFISARSPYNLYAGEVKYGDLQMIFPFNNQLVLCSISGRKLRDQFFETENSNYYIAYGSYGESVRKNIDLNATYYIIIDTYSSQYAPNGCTEIARYDETTFARDLLAAYVKKGGLA